MPAPASAAAGAAPAVRVAPPPPRAFGTLVTGPILPSLLRLAWPMIVVFTVQTFVGVAETYFVSHLGTAALAGAVLVFPVLMLMMMMSTGGMGGGTASAVARALGGGRTADANAIVLHGVVLAVALGLVFTVGVIAGGRPLYRALGGQGEELELALVYSHIIFGGAVIIWIVSQLTAALRGAGNVKAPAAVILGGAAIVLPLSPSLIFGIGPLPGLGIAGAAVAVLTYYTVALIGLVVFMRSRHSPVRLVWAPLQWRLFRDILAVGALSSVGTLQANLTVAIVTALAGAYGVDALAGYGIATRLDYLLIPLLFGLGTATITMVGVNIGAGHIARARRIAWISAALAAAVTKAIGLFAAFFPQVWSGLFSHDQNVLAVSATYLGTVGPFYGLVGVGMLIYFASQGAKRVLWPVLAGTARLLIVALGGWLLIASGNSSLTALVAVVAASSATFGAVAAVAMMLQRWEPPKAST
jgi:putative MATE family efflux protein